MESVDEDPEAEEHSMKYETRELGSQRRNREQERKEAEEDWLQMEVESERHDREATIQRREEQIKDTMTRANEICQIKLCGIIRDVFKPPTGGSPSRQIVNTYLHWTHFKKAATPNQQIRNDISNHKVSILKMSSKLSHILKLSKT